MQPLAKRPVERNFGSFVINGKEPEPEGHQVHKGRRATYFYGRFSFVTSPALAPETSAVYFVFEKGFPVKNGRARIFKKYAPGGVPAAEESAIMPRMGTK
ncbi:MAG: hypothetical protein DPW18_13865 [Chloroflexi bacterium]|nr:hypothetical protein [Chloroflexota bacterium]MDL1942895.1 hypothetical protein [Chloroflexi bacterium CFX2]